MVQLCLRQSCIDRVARIMFQNDHHIHKRLGGVHCSQLRIGFMWWRWQTKPETHSITDLGDEGVSLLLVYVNSKQYEQRGGAISVPAMSMVLWSIICSISLDATHMNSNFDGFYFRRLDDKQSVTFSIQLVVIFFRKSVWSERKEHYEFYSWSCSISVC